MNVACPSCRAVFEIDASLAAGPGLPLCDACSSAGIAPPPIRRSRPKMKALEFTKRKAIALGAEAPPTPAAGSDPGSFEDLEIESSLPATSAEPSDPALDAHAFDGGFAPSRRPSSIVPDPVSPRSRALSSSDLTNDAEPVSLHDLGLVLGPAAAPPAWASAPRGRFDEVASKLEPRASRREEPTRTSSRDGDSSGLMDIRRLAASAASRDAKAQHDAKPSFFQVESIAPPASEDIPVLTDDEPPPSSGHADLQSLLGSPTESRAERATPDFLNLSGGLFGQVQAAPRRIDLMIDPAPITSQIAPVLRLDQGPPSSRVAASETNVAEDSPRSPKSGAPDPVVSERRPARRGGVLGWVAGVAAAAIVTGLVASRLAAPNDTPRDVAVTVTSKPSLPASAEPAARVGREVEPARAPTPAPTATAIETARAVDSSRSAARAPLPTNPTATPKAPAITATAALQPPPRPTPPPSAPPSPPPSGGGDFDKGAAKAALGAAASMASSCKEADDPNGGARVSVTFAPSGRVTSSKILGPPFAGTKTGGCIARAFRTITVPPFSGDPVTITKEVSVR